MYKTILVPLDGSQRAEKILPHVEALTHKFGSRLVLVQVIEPMATVISSDEAFPYYMADEVDRLNEAAKAYLTGVQAKLRDQGIETTSCVENGPVVFSILSVAEREQADLMALASHGRTGLVRVFYGSVAAGILNRADRPLLLIRAQD